MKNLENYIIDYYNLLDMLRTIDTEKNDSKVIKETLNYIADELEKYGDLMKGSN